MAKRRGERLICASRLTMEDIFQWCFLFVCEIYILFSSVRKTGTSAFFGFNEQI